MSQRSNHEFTKRSSAFTLIELVVVMAIILLLIGIAVPAVGPMMNSQHQSQVMQQLTGAVTIAQTRAQNRGGYALRIEPAFKTDAGGFMVDRNNKRTLDTGFAGPVYLGYQQIRYLNPPREGKYYTPTLDDPIKLPKGVWLAPDYALYTGWPFAFDTDYITNELQKWPTSGNFQGLSYNPFETFCIGFDQRGDIIELRPGNDPPTRNPNPAQVIVTQSDQYSYQDQTQPISTNVYPVIDYRYPSARGVLMYDRQKFLTTANRLAFLQREGHALYINRFLGTLVEGGQ